MSSEKNTDKLSHRNRQEIEKQIRQTGKANN